MSRVLKPPTPIGSRPDVIRRDGAFERELNYRQLLHDMMDASLEDVLAPGDDRHVPPHRRLYRPLLTGIPRDASALAESIAGWRSMYSHARSFEAQQRSMVTMLRSIEPLLCRRGRPVGGLWDLAFAIGTTVHRRIMARYRAAYQPAGHVIACDNRVYFPDRTSVRLSELAGKQPDSVFGAANWSLAGQRCDIIDVTRREMWEIKSIASASFATLQLWGYLDNYEVARVMTHYRGDAPIPRLRAGLPSALPKSVTAPFRIRLGPVVITVTPMVENTMPGLILYALTPQLSSPKAHAAAVMSTTDVDVTAVLVGARSDLKQLLDARDSENRRLLVYAAVGVVLVVAVGAVAVAAATLTPAATAAVLAGAGTVLRLPVAKAVVEVAAKRAAAVLVIVSGRQFTVPAETAVICLEGGCEVGQTAIGTARQ